MRTLCIDIGGTGIKGMVLDAEATPLTDRFRVRTPSPAVPEAVFAVIDEVIRKAGEFDRVSVGFPGVVIDGTTLTAPNLGDGWAGCKLAEELSRRTSRPVRALNDCGLQGLGVIEGQGTEILVTLGTGMGFGLYIDGRYVPNVEFGHHPFRKKRTYEERVCNAELKAIGKRKWNARVMNVLEQLAPIFNFRKLYLGGGNARYVNADKLPPNVSIVDNVAGLRGGVRLWAL
ncbi:MAG: ROK family protein [Polyangiaceae bacterium]|nr:ROK family protein [Polyangiaceae bacterium]